jgi:hypothetical protein
VLVLLPGSRGRALLLDVVEAAVEAEAQLVAAAELPAAEQEGPGRIVPVERLPLERAQRVVRVGVEGVVGPDVVGAGFERPRAEQGEGPAQPEGQAPPVLEAPVARRVVLLGPGDAVGGTEIVGRGQDLAPLAGIEIDLGRGARLPVVAVGQDGGAPVALDPGAVRGVVGEGAEEDGLFPGRGPRGGNDPTAVPAEAGAEGERGRVGPPGQDLDDPAQGVRPVEDRGGALDDPDALDLVAQNGAQVVAVEVRLVDGNAVDEQGRFVVVEAAELGAGLALAAGRDVGPGGEGQDLGEVARGQRLEEGRRKDRRRRQRPVLGHGGDDDDLLGDDRRPLLFLLSLFLGREPRARSEGGQRSGGEEGDGEGSDVDFIDAPFQ